MNDATIRTLVEFLFNDNPDVTFLETRAQDSSFPRCLLSEDFVSKLSHVFTIKEAILCIKWSSDFDDFYSGDQLIVQKSYFSYLIFSCLKEMKCQLSAFENFITVCAGVEYFSRTTFRIAGLDFHELNTDIFMEIYDSTLKRTFNRRNGFEQFVEYIRNHKYLSWDLKMIPLAIISDPSASDLKEKLKKEVVSARKTLESYKVDEAALRNSAIDMAQKLLSKLSVKFAGFSSNPSTKDSATASSPSDSSKLHASTKSVKQKDLPSTSAEPPILPIDRASKGTGGASAKKKKKKVSSATSVKPPMLPTDHSSKGTVKASTKAKTQNISSVTSVEPPILPSDRAANETASASTDTMKQEVPLMTSVEPPILPIDRASKGTVGASAKKKKKKVSSAISVKPPILPTDHSSKRTVGASTKAKTQNISSVTSVEPPILPSDRAAKETASASTDTMKQEVPLMTSVGPPILTGDRDSKGKPSSSTKTNMQKVPSKELPTFSSNHDSNQIVNVSKPTNATKKVEEKETIKTRNKFVPVRNSQDILNPCANYQSDTKLPDTSAMYESVVQAVIKYNESNTALPASSKAAILKKVGEVVEYLKDTIKSLIDLLDNYDEE